MPGIFDFVQQARNFMALERTVGAMICLPWAAFIRLAVNAA
jgi:hypothetical protein